MCVPPPQCPSFKRDGDKETPEPFAEPAKYFTESRLLQQDVKLLIEGVSNQLVLATIIHPVRRQALCALILGYPLCSNYSTKFCACIRDSMLL